MDSCEPRNRRRRSRRKRLRASLLAFIVVYFTVFGAGVFYILRLMAKPPVHDEPDSPSDAHLRSAGIVPAPALESVGELPKQGEGLR